MATKIKMNKSIKEIIDSMNVKSNEEDSFENIISKEDYAENKDLIYSAQKLYELRNYDASIEKLDCILEKTPSHIGASLLKILVYTKSGNNEKIKDEMIKIVFKEPIYERIKNLFILKVIQYAQKTPNEIKSIIKSLKKDELFNDLEKKVDIKKIMIDEINEYCKENEVNLSLYYEKND